jgi:hypothetical protein
MGTRADFYVGRGKKAKWVGSIAWDGYPDGIEDTGIFKAKTKKQFLGVIKKMQEKQDDFTSPKDGWPWPWDDSATTDYAYAFDKGVWVSCFGSGWVDANKAKALDKSGEEFPDSDKAEFPDMKEKKNVTLGKRSGIIVVQKSE